MRSDRNSILLIWLAAALLLLPYNIRAQEKSEREIKLHDNVRLIENSAPQGAQKELTAAYQHFWTLFEEILKNDTADWPTSSELIVRVAPGIKKIGSSKTQRPVVRVTAYRKESKREFVGTLLLYSYATQGPIQREDIEEFLNKQILGPIKRIAWPTQGK
jgi:hypothetical protein